MTNRHRSNSPRFFLAILKIPPPPAWRVKLISGAIVITAVEMSRVFTECRAKLSGQGRTSELRRHRPVMLVSIALLFLLIVPAFFAMTRFPGALTLYLATVILCALQAQCCVGRNHRIAPKAEPVWYRRDSLRARHDHFWRHDTIRHPLADRSDRERYGARLVHDRGPSHRRRRGLNDERDSTCEDIGDIEQTDLT